MVYYCYSGSRPKLQEWKKYYDCSKLCLRLDPQTILLQFYSTDQSPAMYGCMNTFFMSMVDWQKEKGATLKAVISSFQALVPREWSHTNYCIAICFQHYHHPARNCDLQLWEFCSRKTQGMNLSNPQALVF